MTRAMQEEGIDGELGEALRDALAKTADWMRNQPG
jgi:truncated hemoglobin YjbI